MRARARRLRPWLAAWVRASAGHPGGEDGAEDKAADHDGLHEHERSLGQRQQIKAEADRIPPRLTSQSRLRASVTISRRSGRCGVAALIRALRSWCP